MSTFAIHLFPSTIKHVTAPVAEVQMAVEVGWMLCRRSDLTFSSRLLGVVALAHQIVRFDTTRDSSNVDPRLPLPTGASPVTGLHWLEVGTDFGLFARHCVR